LTETLIDDPGKADGVGGNGNGVGETNPLGVGVGVGLGFGWLLPAWIINPPVTNMITKAANPAPHQRRMRRFRLASWRAASRSL
jgi:hypothetical protein